MPWGMPLGQIYSILVFLFTQSHTSHSSYTHTQKKKPKRPPVRKKACNHTRGGARAPPAVGHVVFLTLPPEPKQGAPVPSHACTRTLTYVLHPEEVQCVSVCLREEGEFNSS